MRVLMSIDELNYRELLPQFAHASAVTIVTFSMELRRNNELWRALRSIPAGGKLILIACIPDCAMNFFHTAEGKSAAQIMSYYAALNPANFRCTTESFLSHHNHAKIIRCDGQGYIGSANFTMGSAKNFEAGYLTARPEDLARMDGFIETIRARSIPYFRVRASLHVQYLLQFAADVSWLAEQVRFEAYEEREIYKDVWESSFVLDGFGVPDRVLQSLREASAAWGAIQTKIDTGQPLTAGEEAIADSGVSNTLERLLTAAESICSKELLPEPLDEERAGQSLIQNYLMEENPADNQEFLAEVEEAVEKNRRDREVAAKEEMQEFLRMLEDAGTEIFSTLRG